jgi:hypothetical protein
MSGSETSDRGSTLAYRTPRADRFALMSERLLLGKLPPDLLATVATDDPRVPHKQPVRPRSSEPAT